MLASLLFALASGPAATATVGDTIRLEVGAKEVDGRVYAPHAARVRVWVGPGEGRMRSIVPVMSHLHPISSRPLWGSSLDS